MDMIDRVCIVEIKQFLLAHSASKIVDEAILEKLIGRFSVLFEVFKLQTEGMADSERLLLIDTFSIWLLRSTQFLSNKKINTDGFMEKLRHELLDVKNSRLIFQYVIDFWIDGTSAFTNALKGMFSKFLKLLNVVYLLEDKTALFKSWLIKTLEISSTLSVQYYLIEALSPEIDLYVILEQRPAFVENSLALLWSDSLSTSIGRCITSLLVNVYKIHFKENGSALDNWFNIWQGPILKSLQDIRIAKQTELYILMPLFKNVPKRVFLRFVQRLSSSEVDIVFLTSLFRVGQQLGLEEEPYHNDKLISLHTVESLLQQDEYKLYAFQLLTFSVKSSKPVYPYIFGIIKRNLRIFFVDAHIETRNYFCSTLKRFILRIRDSTYSLNRDRDKLIKAQKSPGKQIEKLDQINMSQEFLEWLVSFLKTQICPGTQYQRNTLSFKILAILVETGLDESVPKKYLDLRNFRPYPFSVGISRDMVLQRLLIDNLTSNYDDIRRTAKKLLTISFDPEVSKHYMMGFNWGNLQWRVTQYLEVYQNTNIGAALQDFLFFACDSQKKFIEDLLNRLQEKIQKFKKEYLKHQDDPVSGYFATLTLILKNNKFDGDLSRIIISKSFSLILNNWNATEEFLCGDLFNSQTHEDSSRGRINNDPFIIAKAFRSIKESSLLLEVLVTRDSVTFTQLKSAGDLMIMQLSNLRHNGAVQSVLPSFIACCGEVSKKYPAQLKEWLNTVLDFLEVKTQMVTRRSGGIPFLLTIILAAERGTERPLLKFAYRKLERIADLSVVHLENFDLPQVNAFNCIRSIFIESKLSEACSPYVASALNLSLKNFNSNIYALRNCSLMLFSSLQNRIFGKADKSISARLFFTRYNGIRELLLNVLENSVENPSGRDKFPMISQSHVESIFLVLNVLMRLRPTPGYDGLDIFIKKVSQCLESTHWKIREMAAKTISSLIHDPSSKCEELLKTASVKKQNRLHGHLLAVRAIITDKRDILEEKRDESKIFGLLHSMKILATSHSFVTSKEYIETAEYFMSCRNIGFHVKRDFLAHLGHFFLTHNDHFSLDAMKQLCLSAALRILLKYEQSDNIQPLCQLGILSPFDEVQKVALNYVVDNLDLSNISNLGIVAALKNAFKQNEVRLSSQGRVLRVLKEVGHYADLCTIENLILESRNEDLQLSAIEMAGCVVDQRNMTLMNIIIQKYAKDDVSVDYRKASLNSFRNFLARTIEPKAVLQLHKMLSDDDEEIRRDAADSLNKLFLEESQFRRSPSITGSLIAEKYATKFSHSPGAAYNVARRLKEFILSYDVCSPTTEIIIQGLFEVEKNNQFRNEIEENVQDINILKKMRYNSTEFISWLEGIIDRLINFLEYTNIFDGPLGWASNDNVFSRVYVLRILSGIYLPERSPELEKVLKNHDVHPMVFNYLSIDF